MTQVPSHLQGVSFVVPVRNGAPWIRAVFEAIWHQHDGRPMEVIAVHDGSDDGSGELLKELAARGRIRVIGGGGRGAAACINIGIRAARFPIVCQIDQDVILGPDWLALVTAHLEDQRVAAVQGCYTRDPGEGVIARVMALDLAQRYAAMPDSATSHVCTGNTAYRANALHHVGLFDEQLGYGYDNDMSYRLQDAGYRLLFCRDARSFHRWRDTFGGYCTQQYGFGYGRLEVVSKHPRRVTGDSVSPLPMMLHPLLTLGAVANLCAAAVAMWAGYPPGELLVVALVLLSILALERSVAAFRGLRTWNDRAALLFPVLHFVRDVVWSSAIVTWCARRTLGLRGRPSHSMAPRRHPGREWADVRLKADATYKSKAV
jgi:cellulose synthase/poly-beta-1,6-N-acetylglucosamine synthase-like glycosyltransferase